ncbi:Ferrous iron transport protein B [Desulfovibrio sp. DV]|nr:Ferrous iron transport protein B [Desulfovibrio sp. DV]
MRVIDLPGTYSLTAYSQEELVARNFIVDQRPNVVVDIINTGALERNLYLAVQFMELGVPVILALNMIDEVRKRNITIDSARLAKLMNVPVIETVARTGAGKKELLGKAVAVAEKQREWRPLALSYGPVLDPALEEMSALIEREALLTDRYPARWVALKYLEGDEEVQRLGRSASPAASKLEELAARVTGHCKTMLNTYPEAVITDHRYQYITSALNNGVVTREKANEGIQASDRLDRVLTHPYVGPPLMALILYTVYKITFGLGKTPLTWVQDGFDALGQFAGAVIPEGLLKSLVVSGVIHGVGGIMVFVPLIMIMFFLLSFLEDSGYMARMAYMLDRVLRIFGLHGSSVMPYVVSGGIAGGCAVPGIMSTRTLRSPKEKLATILTSTLMACGAKLPVFILLVAAFFPDDSAMAMFLITMLGWIMALLVAKALRSTIIKGPATPFVMELPPYRIPTLRSMCIHTWEKTSQYLRKAGTIILAISILLWAAMTFPTLPGETLQGFEADKAAIEERIASHKAGSDSESGEIKALEEKATGIENEQAQAALRHSLAGRFGIALEPVSKLAGFDWRTNIALIGGFAAKEVVVATLGTAYSLGEVKSDEPEPLSEKLASDPAWSPLVAASLIVFVLLYSPCLVSVVTMARETSWKWAAFAMTFDTVMAFGLAVAVFQVGKTFL